MDNSVLIMEPKAPTGTKYMMQCQEYAWAGDIHAAQEVLRLKEKHDLSRCVETGSYIGTTTIWLAAHFENVISIEIIPRYYDIAKSRTAGLPNVDLRLGEGKDVLKNMDGKYLAFLDAHPVDGTGKGYDVVIQELEAIAVSGTKPILVLHDFQVPDHPEFQFDRYEGEPFSIQWVGPSLDRIYGVGKWDSHYNEEATGVKVGILYIEPA